MDALPDNVADLLEAVGGEDSSAAYPGAVADILQVFEPSLLLLADAEGNLVAEDTFNDAAGPHLAGPLAVELAGCLGTNDSCRLEITTAAGPQLALVLRIPGGPSREILGCLLPRCQASSQRLDETPTELVVCGAFAWAAMHHNAHDARLRRRVQHLQAEQETLRNSHAEAVAAFMEERERRRRQQREKAALEELVQATEAASRAKSEFLANASHELRTPMTAILGYADLLADPKLADDQRKEHLQTIRRNGKALLVLIDNVLDLSQIEAGKLTVKRTDCSPFRVVEELVSLLRVWAVEEGLELELDYVFPIPQTIHTDPARLRQVIMNLIGNAIKFTERGGVRVAVSCGRPPASSPRLQFAVSDTGTGMTGETITRLFEPFIQADTSSTRSFGGSGLGLAVSRRLARMLGGDIEVTSTPGKGSTLTVSIDPGPLKGVPMLDGPPAASAEKVAPAETKRERKLHGRVLLAEDGKDNQRLIGFFLKKAGLEVVLAENGRIACECVLAAAAEERPFDLILMDMQMPEMDGYEATRRLRQDGWKNPIVALTAHAMAGDREKCLQAGCDSYLTKPIERKSFLAAVEGYLAGTRSQPSEAV